KNDGAGVSNSHGGTIPATSPTKTSRDRALPSSRPAQNHLLRMIDSAPLSPRLTEQRFAAQLLQGLAGAWHATFLAMQERDHVPTWQEFRQAFRAHYILASLMEQKQREFRELEQGNKTMMQYVQSFIYLSQYAPEDVADDTSLSGQTLARFTDLVDTTLDMENRLCIANKDQKRKRQANIAVVGSSQKQKPTYQPPQYQRPRFVV
ncbi:hypothetical protein U9M48_028352, partial [Paspalum notatum var. saurae]